METLHILDKSYSYQDFTPFLLSPTKIVINKDLKKKIRESYNRLTDIISSGQTIYGVNTGFGQLSQIKIAGLPICFILSTLPYILDSLTHGSAYLSVHVPKYM